MKDDFEKEIDEILNEDVILEEVLNETDNADILNEGFVYKSFDASILVNPDSGGRLSYLPYFKIIDSTSITKATKIARITFEDHHYIIHNDRLKQWDLTSSDIEMINSVLLSITSSGKTVYEELLDEGAILCGFNNTKEFIKKYNISTAADISDVHYLSNIDKQKSKRKGFINEY